MNKKVTTKFFFLSLMLFTNNIVQAYTVNGVELSSIIKPGEVLFYEDPTQNNICLLFEDNSVKIGSLPLNNIQEVIEYRDYLLENKNKLYNQTSPDSLTISSESSITVDGAYLSSDSAIQFEAQTDITIDDAILKGKSVNFICNNIESRATFIETNIIHLQAADPASPIKIIRFILNENVTIPHTLDGVFKFNEASGTLLVVGAVKVEIIFDPKLVS